MEVGDRVRSSVLDMLNVRYPLDTQLEILSMQLNIEIWSSGRVPKCRYKFDAISTQIIFKATRLYEMPQRNEYVFKGISQSTETWDLLRKNNLEDRKNC